MSVNMDGALPVQSGVPAGGVASSGQANNAAQAGPINQEALRDTGVKATIKEMIKSAWIPKGIVNFYAARKGQNIESLRQEVKQEVEADKKQAEAKKEQLFNKYWSQIQPKLSEIANKNNLLPESYARDKEAALKDLVNRGVPEDIIQSHFNKELTYQTEASRIYDGLAQKENKALEPRVNALMSEVVPREGHEHTDPITARHNILADLKMGKNEAQIREQLKKDGFMGGPTITSDKNKPELKEKDSVKESKQKAASSAAGVSTPQKSEKAEKTESTKPKPIRTEPENRAMIKRLLNEVKANDIKKAINDDDEDEDSVAVGTAKDIIKSGLEAILSETEIRDSLVKQGLIPETKAEKASEEINPYASIYGEDDVKHETASDAFGETEVDDFGHPIINKTQRQEGNEHILSLRNQEKITEEDLKDQINVYRGSGHGTTQIVDILRQKRLIK